MSCITFTNPFSRSSELSCLTFEESAGVESLGVCKVLRIKMNPMKEIDHLRQLSKDFKT